MRMIRRSLIAAAAVATATSFDSLPGLSSVEAKKEKKDKKADKKEKKEEKPKEEKKEEKEAEKPKEEKKKEKEAEKPKEEPKKEEVKKEEPKKEEPKKEAEKPAVVSKKGPSSKRPLLSEYVSQDKGGELLEMVQKWKKSDNSFANPEQGYLYAALNKESEGAKGLEKLCKPLEKVKDSGKLENAYYVFATLEQLGDCDLKNQPSLKKLDDALTSAKYEDLFFAVAGLNIAPSAKKKKKKFTAIFENTVSAIQDDGLIDGSWSETVKAVAVVNAISTKIDLEEADKKGLLAKLKALAKAEVEAVPEPRAVAEFLKAYSELMSFLGEKDTAIPESFFPLLDGLVEFVAANPTADEAVHAYLFLKTVPESLTSFKVAPIKGANSKDKSVTVRAAFCGVLGEPLVPEGKVKLLKGKDFPATEMKKKENSDCVFEGKVELKTSGEAFLKSYAGAEFEVSFGGSGGSKKAKRTWRSTFFAELSSLEMSAGLGRSKAEPKYGLSGENKMDLEYAKYDDTQTMFFEMSVRDKETKKAVLPHQVAVIFKIVGQKNGIPLGVPEEQLNYFTPIAGSGSLSLSIPLSNRKLIQPFDSDYEISVIAADRNMDEGIMQKLGKIRIQFSTPLDLTVAIDQLPGGKDGADQSKTAVSTSEYKHYTASTPIEHLFRSPEKRPNFLISSIFLGAMIVLFLAFNLILLNHFNLKLIGFMSSVFFALLALVVFTIWCFFIWLTLFQVLTFVTPMVGVLILVGNKELSSCKEKRSVQSANPGSKKSD